MSKYETYANYKDGVLTSAASGITYILIDPKATTIFGSGESENAFVGCQGTLESFAFDGESMLETIQQCAFFNCYRLTKIDLSQCSHLKTIGAKAFLGCSAATELKFPQNLVSLGYECFKSNYLIQSIEFPDSLSSIGTSSFYGCSSVVSIIISDYCNLRSLPDRSFQSCSKLVTFNIPKNIVSFAFNALEACFALKTITVSPGNTALCAKDGILFNAKMTKLILCPIQNTKTYVLPNTVLTLGSVSFANTILEEIDLGSNLQKIESYVFQFSHLKSLNMPDSVTSFGVSLCYGCVYLKSVKLSNSITQVSTNAFTNTPITSIEIPEGVTSIGNNCFKGCTSLRDVKMPSSIKTCGGGIFAGCSKLNITMGENASLTISESLLLMNKEITYISGYFGSEESITIPATITNIMESAFNSKNTLVKVIFESDSTLTSIDVDAFFCCTSLSSIAIPKSVQYISRNAFFKCTSLKTLELPENLISIGERAFGECTSLTEVIFHKHLSASKAMNRWRLATSDITLYESCFMNCKTLEKVEFVEGISSIQKQSFYNCSSLKSVSLPSTLSNIGEDSFAKTGIEELTIPENSVLTRIPDKAFNNLNCLKAFKIPPNCCELGAFALASTAIENIIIPPSVQKVGLRCFSGCTNLASFYVESYDSQLEIIGDFLFDDCSSLATIFCNNSFYVTESNVLLTKQRDSIIAFPPASKILFFSVPSTITKIGPNAFYRCNNLLSIQLQDNSVKTISASAFEGCKNLEYVNIPKCVEAVGQNAFKGCKKLHCGLFIENKTAEFTDILIQTGKMPLKCFKKCGVLVTNYRKMCGIGSKASVYLMILITSY